ncbi:centromere protein X isoform X1 [Apodemus sylvaticus]|uniref:centromere protein X isoform X1 n=1 Tax=Apodemus sylvaticus TaxID=10129 RepID=UPI002241A90C|nr:centromere protein X isoform X1 [Apodemus sylvaticus]
MEENGGFRKELVNKLLHLHFRDCKTKVSGDALQLMAEFLRIFVLAPGLLEFPSCGLPGLVNPPSINTSLLSAPASRGWMGRSPQLLPFLAVASESL